MASELRVEGLVAHESSFTITDLEALGSVVEDVSSVAEGAVGRAVPASQVVAAAHPAPEATHCTVIAADDSYRASVPLDDLVAGGWLAFGLDGAALPTERGGPLRLTVARGSTLCWNVKNVGTLRLTSGAEADDVPENPPH